MPLKPLGKQLPPVLDPNLPWQSPGIVRDRPTACGLCRYHYKSVGFTSTFVGKTPKIGIVFPHPDSEEVVSREALDSARGRRFLHENIEPLGLTKEDLVISYVIRCLPPWSKKTREREFPTGKMRENATEVCRRYDRLKGLKGDLVTGGIIEFDPDMFIFSFDPQDIIRIPAYTRIIQRCFDKAAHFMNLGYKPCVLLGEEAVTLQCPWVKSHGGLKQWVGGYVEQKWKSL